MNGRPRRVIRRSWRSFCCGALWEGVCGYLRFVLWAEIRQNSLSSTSSEVCLWDVYTSRGIVSTEKVINCMNAYAALLLPCLESFTTPNRAQAHSLIPTSYFVGMNILKNTLSLRYSLHHFYSLIQRQQDGTLILGVSRFNPTLNQETIDGQISTDDTKYNEEIAQDALRSFGKIFPDSNRDFGLGSAIHGEGLDHAWTGIIAMTVDSVPFVGEVEGLEGQFVCAGFNGHGKLSFSFPFNFPFPILVSGDVHLGLTIQEWREFSLAHLALLNWGLGGNGMI